MTPGGEFIDKRNVLVSFSAKEICKWLAELMAKYHFAGSSLERVRRVNPQPKKFDNGCAAPVLKTVDEDDVFKSKNPNFKKFTAKHAQSP